MKRKCIICKGLHENQSLLCESCSYLSNYITFFKKGKKTIYKLNKKGKELWQKKQEKVRGIIL